MAKEIISGSKAREKIEKGIDTLCNTVKITLGPKGRNVILERNGNPIITNDGVTIAKEITLKDPHENLGAKIICEASTKTNEMAGDGTTTACVLAQALYKEGIKNTTAGANPLLLGKGIKKATKVVIDELEKQSQKIKTNKDIEQVATISCQDEEIGKLIASAFEKVGNDGVITLEEGNKSTTTLEVVQGLQFDKGFSSPYMSTNTQKQICEMENPYILITDQKIDTINQVLPILEKVAQQGGKLAIIAPDFSEEVVATLVVNKLRGSLNIVTIKSPAFGEQRHEILSDLCILCGANYISLELNKAIEDTDINDLGSCKQLLVTKDTTTIVEGKGEEELIENRIELIKALRNDCEDSYDISIYTDRLNKLSGGVAVIKVGAITEVEMNEKKLRLEDALSATKSAIEEGTVIGGGCAYIKTTPSVEKLIETLDSDEKTGAKILLNALFAPINQIAENSGFNGGIVIENVKKGNADFGFDAFNGTYCSLREKGIIDPKKVTRSALENAVSVVTTLLTTESIVCEEVVDYLSKT
ncbi:MAG: chaperonin GroEL [Clostridia bacterium]|nr:chaperonin GroEL [Clostridia bacterium]